jgi:hypothetical protein
MRGPGWIRPTCLLIATTLSTGCVADSPIVRTICPPLPAYTADQEHRLADELEAAPATAAWPDMMVDYYAVRERCAALSH